MITEGGKKVRRRSLGEKNDGQGLRRRKNEPTRKIKKKKSRGAGKRKKKGGHRG